MTDWEKEKILWFFQSLHYTFYKIFFFLILFHSESKIAQKNKVSYVTWSITSERIK